MKTYIGTLQGDIAQPSLDQLPGWQKFVVSQVGQAGTPHYISYEEAMYG
jgi:hypothetical protein